MIGIADAKDEYYSSQVFVLSHSLSTLRVGCVDPDASNYDSDAQIDDEPTTCVYKDAVVWLDCDHNPSWDLVDWSQTDCVGTISGSRCDVSCVHGYTAERPLCYNNSWVDNGGCLPNPCDSDPTILNLNTTSSKCEGFLGFC